MKKILISFGLLVATMLSAQESYLLVGGSGWNKIALIEKSSADIVWTHDLGPAEENNAVAAAPNGHILYSYKNGAKLIDLNHNVLWDYPAPKGTELFTATNLPGGGFLLGYCGHPARLIELNAKGAVKNEVEFETGIPSVHGQFRQAIKSKKGTYIVPLMGKSAVVELDKQGKELNRWSVKGNPFSVLEQPNGNLIAACGDAHIYVEIDRKNGTTVREVTNEQIASSGCEFNFVAQIEKLRNKNLLVCNWNGHLKSNQTIQPSLLEVDSNNQVVWKLKENKEIGKISAVASYPFAKKLKNELNNLINHEK